MVRSSICRLMKPLLFTILCLLLSTTPFSLVAQTLYPVERGGRWGFIDEKGKIVIPLQFDRALDFPYGVGGAPVQSGGKWGLMDREGKWIVSPVYDEAVERPYDSSLLVLQNNRWSVVDRNGVPYEHEGDEADVVEVVDEIWKARPADQPFDDSRHRKPVERNRFEHDGLYGYRDAEGRMVIPPLYDYAGSFSASGLALVGFEDESAAEGSMDDSTKAFHKRRHVSGKKLSWGVIDTAGREVLPLEFQQIEFVSFSQLLRVRRNGKWGLFDYAGKERIRIEYDHLNMLDSNLVAVCSMTETKDGDTIRLWGVRTTDGKAVLPTRYDGVATGVAGQLLVARDSLWGVCDSKGREIIAPRYLNIEPMRFDYYFVFIRDSLRPRPRPHYKGLQVSARVGIMVKSGAVAVEPTWLSSCLLTRQTDTGKNIKAEFGYHHYRFSADNGIDTLQIEQVGKLLRVERSMGNRCFIERDGSLADISRSRDFAAVESIEFHDGAALVWYPPGRAAFVDTAGMLLFYLDTLGRKVQPVENFYSEGKVPIRVDERGLAYYDKSGRRLFGTYARALSFSEGLAAVHDPMRTTEWLISYVDSAGNEVIPPRFNDAGMFVNGLAPAAVRDSGRKLWGYINREGEWKIAPQFLDAHPFSDGYARVKVNLDTIISDSSTAAEESEDKGALWGYIDPAGRVVIDPAFTNAWDFRNGRGLVTTAEGIAIIDPSGTVIATVAGEGAQPERIGDFSEGLAPASVTAESGKVYHGYVNSDGEWVIPPRFVEAGRFNGGIAAVTTLELREPLLYIDFEGNVIWQGE